MAIKIGPGAACIVGLSILGMPASCYAESQKLKKKARMESLSVASFQQGEVAPFGAMFPG